MIRLARILLAASLLPLSGLAAAQSFAGAGGLLTNGLAELRAKRVLPEPLQQRPTAATGFPNAPAEVIGQLPAPQQGDQELRIERISKQKTIGPKHFLASDGVELYYRGYHIFADSVDANLETSIFTAKGDVRIFGEDAQISGDEVTIDYNNRSYRAVRSKARVKPVLTGGNLQGDLFIRGGESAGTERRYTFQNGDLTTCEYDDPHFYIKARDGVVRPGREARLKDVKVNILGRDVIRFGSLWIPLTNREYEYLPQVGESPDEGYYVKNRYAFPLGRGSDTGRSNYGLGRDVGEVRLDEMTKLGTGLGLGYGYASAFTTGLTRIYGIIPTLGGTGDTQTIHNEHNQKFKFGLFQLTNDIQRSNYLTAPNATVVTSRGTLNLNSKPGNTTLLGFNRNSSSSPTYSTTNQTISLQDRRNFAGLARTNFQLDLNGSSSESGTTTTERKTLDIRFRGEKDIKAATLALDYQRTVPIGEIQNFFGGSDRTPVLTLASDSRRLFPGSVDKALPFTTELSLGEYADPIEQGRISRGSYLFDFRRAGSRKGPWRLDLTGRYRQAMYSDDTAQYLLATGITTGYQVARKLEINARYNYLRPYGYSPLLIDRSGTTNLITLDASAYPIRNLTLGVQTGYDIERIRQEDVGWQQVGVRAEYAMGRNFSLRTLATYDTFQGLWSNVRIDSQIYGNNGFQLAVGTRYDGTRHTFGNVNVFMDGLQIGRTRLAAVLAYNGYLNQFDSQQVNLIYDLHCAEAVITYSDFQTGFRTGREIRFFLRLKAIPFDSNFGLGRRGQGLGTGTGRDF